MRHVLGGIPLNSSPISNALRPNLTLRNRDRKRTGTDLSTALGLCCESSSAQVRSICLQRCLTILFGSFHEWFEFRRALAISGKLGDLQAAF